MTPSPRSITNGLARRMAIWSWLVAAILAFGSSTPWFSASDLVITSFLGATFTLLGLPTWRNIREKDAEAEVIKEKVDSLDYFDDTDIQARP